MNKWVGKNYQRKRYSLKLIIKRIERYKRIKHKHGAKTWTKIYEEQERFERYYRQPKNQIK